MIDATRPARIRSARNIGLLLIAALFMFMRLRSMWIADGAIVPVSGLDLLVMIDRLGFGIALVAAAAGWWLFRKSGLGPLLRLSLVAAAASALSIAAGACIAAALAAAPVIGMEAWVLAAAATAEIVLLGLLVGQLRLLGHYQAIRERFSAA